MRAVDARAIDKRHLRIRQPNERSSAVGPWIDGNGCSSSRPASFWDAFQQPTWRRGFFFELREEVIGKSAWHVSPPSFMHVARI